jgi:hypothetical protein
LAIFIIADELILVPAGSGKSESARSGAPHVLDNFFATTSLVNPQFFGCLITLQSACWRAAAIFRFKRLIKV